MKRIQLSNDLARQAAKRAIDDAPDGFVVEVKERTRTADQNALMWAMLADIAAQIDWHGVKLSLDEWKDLLSAGLVKSKVVPNIEGNGFVILGQRTSRMTKSEFSDLVALIDAFGSERGVKFSAPERLAA